MKKTLFLVFAILSFQSAMAQKSKQAKNLFEKEIKAYRQKIEKNEYLSDLMKDFSMDTFRIEHTFSAKVREFSNSHDILEVFAETTEAYDVLLNKYYNKLMSKLDADDKKLLIKSQKAWITFRDAEEIVIATVSDEHYSGGGSIQKDMNETSYQELTKMRLLNIIHLLERITE
jgi:uncharacterized protein YecT (DUF1311 family)